MRLARRISLYVCLAPSEFLHAKEPQRCCFESPESGSVRRRMTIDQQSIVGSAVEVDKVLASK